LVIAKDLMGHVVGCGGRGLKQITDISSIRVSAFTQEMDGRSKRLVSIWGTKEEEEEYGSFWPGECCSWPAA